MTENAETVSPICAIPTELLFNIFFNLPAKDLMKCRRVCSRWKSVIDELAKSDALWTNLCRRDFDDYFWIAKRKSNPGVTWFHLYRSLYMWPKLFYAAQEVDEFASASRLIDEVHSVEALGNGMLGVHKKSAIQYFDITTLKMSTRGPITGDYAKYTENDSAIVIQTYHLLLFVIHKVHHGPRQHPNLTIDNVKMFLLTETELFFVKLNEELYVTNINEPKSQMFIRRADDMDGIMSLGYTNGCLNVLTYQRNIYSIANHRDVLFKQSLSNEHNLLDVLYKYNFLEQLDWRVYFQWMYVLNHTVPHGPMRDIIIIRPYGDVFFVGSNFGVLSIFYKPFTDGELDIFSTEPMRRVNFMERSDIPVLASCPILQIDVVETVNGHIVLVAMPKKIAVLKYSHYFEHEVSWALVPYQHCQRGHPLAAAASRSN